MLFYKRSGCAGRGGQDPLQGREKTGHCVAEYERILDHATEFPQVHRQNPPPFWEDIEGGFAYRNRYAGSDKGEDVKFVVAMVRFAAAEKHGTSMRLARVAVEKASQ